MRLAGCARALVVGATLIAAASPAYPAAHAAKDSVTTVRSGNHPDFGRIVVDTNGGTHYQLEQTGDHVVVRFNSDVTLGPAPKAPRNIVSVTTSGSVVDVTTRPGARIHPTRIGGRVVVDVLDPKADAPPPPPLPAAEQSGLQHQLDTIASTLSGLETSPELGGQSNHPPPAIQTSQQTNSAPVQPVEAQPLADPVSAVQPAAPAPAPLAVIQQLSPGRDVAPENTGPLALVARRVKLPSEMDGSAFLLPFNPATGAALFRASDAAYAVFDQRRPIDMAVLREDPTFGKVSVQLLPTGTLVRIPVPPAISIALTPTPRGWRIAALSTSPKIEPIAATLTDGRLDFAAEQPGDVVSLADPDTGATLLVGTQRRPGEGVALVRRSAEFVLRSTSQGVVVEPLSDAMTLKQVAAGFTLTGNSTGLLLSPATSAEDMMMKAAHLTTRLNFPTLQPAALLKRLTTQMQDAAAAPPLARGLKHHAAAESMIGLGMDAEAESLLHLAAEQDPREAASPDTAAMTAIAALLAGRTDEAKALLDPRLDGTDEIALWRGIREAMLDAGSPRAAAIFATTAPLAFRYPAAVRDRIMPLMIETMIKGGAIAPAAQLLAQLKNDPGLGYARALLEQASGNTKNALTMLDALTDGHDQFDRARASVRAVELRLATGSLNKAQAADALDKLLYAWRGDARELALRERIADLRSESGGWRPALAMLRRAETDFPDQAAAVHARLKDMFARMISDQGTTQMSPIEFVSMVDENADLATEPGGDAKVEQALADRLLTLDLPERAKPILDKLLHSAKSDAGKARYGLSLAALDARQGDDAGAQAVLNASEGHDLPIALVEQRMILRAGTVARLGDPKAAAAMLVPFGSVAGTEARAKILETASDWAGAEQAWRDRVALTLPPGGMLDETQTRIVLRLTTAAARAHDQSALDDLRTRLGDRIGAGPLGDMFRLLTAPAVRTSADMDRSKQEVSLAASLPSDLKALQGGTSMR